MDFDYESRKEIILRPKNFGTSGEVKSAGHTHAKAGRYTIAVKVVDIFGNDAMSLARVTVG